MTTAPRWREEGKGGRGVRCEMRSTWLFTARRASPRPRRAAETHHGVLHVLQPGVHRRLGQALARRGGRAGPAPGEEEEPEQAGGRHRVEGAGATQGGGARRGARAGGAAWRAGRESAKSVGNAARCGGVRSDPSPRKRQRRHLRCGCGRNMSVKCHRRLVLCILHSMFFAKEKSKNAAKNYEGCLANICDVISREYIVVFP